MRSTFVFLVNARVAFLFTLHVPVEINFSQTSRVQDFWEGASSASPQSLFRWCFHIMHAMQADTGLI